MRDVLAQGGTRQFLTGIEALAQLPLLQRARDKAAGLDTAGLISGYRGSPLGGYDQRLWAMRDTLEAHDIVFQPGLNEDLAATALWGAQTHSAFGQTRHDGVFGIWYGKGPGVDRSGDAFRCANIVGTSPLGGVLAVAGDDHAAQSSVFPHQTDGIFQSVMMPIFQPANVEDILRLGLAGFALSRYCGLWVAFKTIAEVVEAASTLDFDAEALRFVAPDHVLSPHGLNFDPSIDWPAERMEFERRVVEERLPAAMAWVNANAVNQTIVACKTARMVLVTVGKAHQDVMQALADLGWSAAQLQGAGVAVYKVGCSWPFDGQHLASLFPDAQSFFVAEEKAPIVEDQLKAALFNGTRRCRVTGKTDADGKPLLRMAGEFDPDHVATALIRQMDVLEPALPADMVNSAEDYSASMRSHAGNSVIQLPARTPFFCAGCPHNRSTKTPDGSISGGGIGCHAMALSMPASKAQTLSQMGGEGVRWIGAAPFVERGHIFQNLGDGTYEHSGILAIRAAVAAGTNITYKILYNDAVAMTGGQPLEQATEPLSIVRQLQAEKVSPIVIVSDEPEAWSGRTPTDVEVHHRDAMESVQKRLREESGVSAIVYIQTCAAEKRRRRKRGTFPDPAKRVFINPRVCEGCGDCSVQSNCIAVEPLETPLGTKRQINQSSCNKDFSCINGFCPSFVEVVAPELRRPDQAKLDAHEKALTADLPQPAASPGPDTLNIYITGIGGLGVLTLGALIGTAATQDGKAATVLDFTGLAQKNGAVVSHVRLAQSQTALHAVRIPDGQVDVLLAADALVAAAPANVKKLSSQRSAAVINTGEAPTGENVFERDFEVPTHLAVDQIRRHAREGDASALDFGALAEALFGSKTQLNVMLFGFAYQKGLIPVSLSAAEAALRKGVAVQTNLRAFAWGRAAAHNLGGVMEAAGLGQAKASEQWSLADYAADLEMYQDRAYASRYLAVIQETRLAAAPFGERGEAYVAAVMRYMHKVMAYKDEYEIARLYDHDDYTSALKRQFSGFKALKLWLAPPLLDRFAKSGERPKKRAFGPWILPLFAVLRRLKGLRGTPFDPFGYSGERRRERQLIADYLDLIAQTNVALSDQNIEAAIALAMWPDQIRGFGPIKEAALKAAYAELEALKAALHAPHPSAKETVAA